MPAGCMVYGMTVQNSALSAQRATMGASGALAGKSVGDGCRAEFWVE